MTESLGAGHAIPGAWWMMASHRDLPPGQDWLSGEERQYLEGLRFEKRRDDWLLGRWTAKSALRRSPYGVGISAEPEDFTVRQADDGAPEAWLKGRQLPLAVSISHSHGRGLCALAPKGVLLGCDLEIVQEGSSEFLADYLTLEECADLGELPSDDRDRLATLFWAAKESALKALRIGLRADTRRIQVDLPAEPGDVRNWSVLEVQDTQSSLQFGGWFKLLGDSVAVVVTSPTTGEPTALEPGL